MTVEPARPQIITSTTALISVLALCAALALWLRGDLFGNMRVATAATVFCAIFVQALPFLVLGVVVSGLIAAYVSPERLARWLPRRPSAAVLAAGVAGAALPGCECGSVPAARRLFGDGAAGPAALAFMLSAPAINPVVLVATSVAFPGHPAMVVARLTASLLTALVMGMVWSRWGRAAWITRRLPDAHHHGSGSRWTVFSEAARHDFLQAASYLVVGAAAAALLQAMALAMLGPVRGGPFLKPAGSWVRSGSTYGEVRAKLTADVHDSTSTGAPRKQPYDAHLVVTGLEPVEVEGVEYSLPQVALYKPSLAKSLNSGPYSNRHGWFSAGYGPFRRLTGAGGEEDTSVQYGGGREARHQTIFSESAALTRCEKWLASLHSQANDTGLGDSDRERMGERLTLARKLIDGLRANVFRVGPELRLGGSGKHYFAYGLLVFCV